MISHVPIYNIKYLDLYWSWAEENEDYLDYEKLPIFVCALAKTNLVDSLKHVHIRDSWYSKTEVHSIFKKNGFNVEIDGSHSFPEEMED